MDFFIYDNHIICRIFSRLPLRLTHGKDTIKGKEDRG